MMSTDVCQDKSEKSEDISWDVVITDTEEQIQQARDRVKKLLASLRSFKRKRANGALFPRAASRN
jgi:hypothetical protein